MRRARWSLRKGLLAVGLTAATAGPSGAQVVRVEVRGAEPIEPLQGVLVTLHDAAGATLARDLTNSLGLATLAGVASGEYRLQAELIGFETSSRTVIVPAETTTVVSLTLGTRAIEIEGFSVAVESRCSVRPEGALAVAKVWEEVRKALEAARLTQERNTYQYRTRRYSRSVEEETGRVAEQDARFGQAYQTTPFESRPVEDLLARGFVQDDDDRPGGETYYAPDAEVLVSDPFLDSHCMRLTRGAGEEAGLIGVAFEPVENRHVPDIAGTLWVDPGTWRLSHLEFRYVHTRRDVETHGVGGKVVFQQLPDGTWIVPEWHLRMPWLALRRDAREGETVYQFGFHEVGATVVSVREPGGDVLFTATTAALEGVVVEDGSGPVTGVVVRLDGLDEQTATDAEGAFRFTEVPEGSYVVTATRGETVLASEAVELVGGRVESVRLTVADPWADVVTACLEEPGGRGVGTAVVVGHVTATDGRALAGSRVIFEWQDLTGMRERGLDGVSQARLVATAGEDGAYRACGVPTEVPLEVRLEWQGVRTPPEALRLERVPGVTRDWTIDTGGGRQPPPPVPPLARFR